MYIGRQKFQGYKAGHQAHTFVRLIPHHRLLFPILAHSSPLRMTFTAVLIGAADYE